MMGRKAREAEARADRAEDVAIRHIARYYALANAVADQHARHECRCVWRSAPKGGQHLHLVSDVCRLVGIELFANNSEGSR
jgi:hypothetical protein